MTDTAAPLLLWETTQFGAGPLYADVATDLSGKILWYYYASPPQSIILTRPLPSYSMLTIQNGPAWNPSTTSLQLLRQIDLAGNIKKETNTGAMQAQLVKMGATDGGPCNIFPSPAPVGAGCLDGFRHDAIQTLAAGWRAGSSPVPTAIAVETGG